MLVCLVGIQEAPCGLYYYRMPMHRWADAVDAVNTGTQWQY